MVVRQRPRGVAAPLAKKNETNGGDEIAKELSIHGEGREGDSSPATEEDAFASAFAKIMYRGIAAQAPGPILSAKPELLAEKLAEGTSRPTPKEKTKIASRHKIPERHTDPHERALLKLGTRGVVRLFNAVSKAQLQNGIPSSSRKGTKGVKRNIELLAELRGTAAQAVAEGNAEKEEPGWSVLRDGMEMPVSAKMKHWDTLESGITAEVKMQSESEGEEDSD